MKIEESFVYLIAHATDGGPMGPVKVGYTKSHPSKRLATLQTGNPSPLEIIFYFSCPSPELAREAEAIFHKVCREKRMSGEWFGMSVKDALATLSKCFIGLIVADIDDAESVNLMLDWTGVSEAAVMCAKMTGVKLQ